MTFSLEMALAKSKRNFAVKEPNESNLVKNQTCKVMVLHNPMANNCLVYENSSYMGMHSVKDISLKYGNSGWEAGK